MSVSGRIVATKKVLLRNVVSNVFGRFVPAILNLFVIPYLVFRLGTDRFGLYVLFSTIANYTVLFDLGISKAYVKFVSEFNVRGDDAKINSLISTSMVFYFFLSLFLAGILFLIEPGIYSVLRIPDALRAEAQIALFVASGSLILSLPLNWTAGVLMGLQRFDAINLIQVVVAILVNGMVLIIAWLGGGLVPLLGAVILGTLLTNILSVLALRRFFPEFRLRFRFDTQMFKQLFALGWKMQIDSLSTFLLSSFNRIPISMMIGPSGVTIFELGMKVAQVIMSFVSIFPTAFVPAASELYAVDGLCFSKAPSTLSFRTYRCLPL